MEKSEKKWKKIVKSKTQENEKLTQNKKNWKKQDFKMKKTEK